MTSSLLDTALDLSVLGGYTSVGYRIRSRGWTPLPRMEGKVVLITGATSGLGLAAVDGFARLGATVWLAVRNRERGQPSRKSGSRSGSTRRTSCCSKGPPPPRI
jgi:dehydrogenase/reductase SDR family member 12